MFLALRRIPSLPFKRQNQFNFANTLGRRKFSTENLSKTGKTPNPETESLAKDIIIYRHDSPKFHILVTIFSISQFIFWSSLGSNIMEMKDMPPRDPKDIPEDEPLWQKFQYISFKKPLAAFVLFFGYCATGLGLMYSHKSIRYLILRKDRKKIALVTFNPIGFGQNTIMNVPIDYTSAHGSRLSGRSIPLKVKDKWFYYIIDTGKGTFLRPDLFDQTCGIKRSFELPKKKMSKT